MQRARKYKEEEDRIIDYGAAFSDRSFRFSRDPSKCSGYLLCIKVERVIYIKGPLFNLSTPNWPR